MGNAQLVGIVQHIRKLVAAEDRGALCDRALLERFVGQRDEAAFEALVQRHGPMVLRVCQRVLHDVHDAEDACQAALLVLARKASSIRRKESLGSWLHGVAYRAASNLKREIARRRGREGPAVEATRPDASEVTWRELRTILDQELLHLPERFRAPLLLCYLEGKTRDEAAQELGWGLGVLRGRLDRGRELLRARLVRRGVTLSGALLATLLTEQSSSAALPVALVGSVLKAALPVAAGHAPADGLVSARVTALLEGVVRNMLLTRIKITTALVLTLCCAGLGAGLLTSGALPAQPPSPGGTRAEEPPAPRGEEQPVGRAGQAADAGQVTRNQAESRLNLKNLMVAFHNYDDTYGHFPAPAIYEGEQNPGVGVPGSRPGGGKGMMGSGMGGMMPGGGGTMGSGAGSTMPGSGGSMRPGIGSGMMPGGAGGTVPEGGAGPTMKPSGTGSSAGGLLGGGGPVGSGAGSSIGTGAGGSSSPGASGSVPPGGGRPGPGGNAPTSASGSSLGGLGGSSAGSSSPAATGGLGGGEGASGTFGGGVKEGKALLSWRVALLPFLGEEKLYKQFKLDEPWDSPHNKKLLEKMPKVYAPPGVTTREPYTTFYQVFVGQHAGFEKHQRLRIPNFVDGLSNIIFLVEAGSPVPWTKPEDLHFAADEPIPELGGLFPSIFNAALADGSVHPFLKKADPEMLRKAIMRDDGYPVDLDRLRAPATRREAELRLQNERLKEELRRETERLESLQREKQVLDEEDAGTQRLRDENARLEKLLRETRDATEELQQKLQHLRQKK